MRIEQIIELWQEIRNSRPRCPLGIIDNDCWIDQRGSRMNSTNNPAGRTRHHINSNSDLNRILVQSISDAHRQGQNQWQYLEQNQWKSYNRQDAICSCSVCQCLAEYLSDFMGIILDNGSYVGLQFSNRGSILNLTGAEIRKAFIWNPGNLFTGPNPQYRRDDSGNALEERALQNLRNSRDPLNLRLSELLRSIAIQINLSRYNNYVIPKERLPNTLIVYKQILKYPSSVGHFTELNNLYQYYMSAII
jgi:hypothetical protein